MTIRPFTAADHEWAATLLDDHFGGRLQPRLGEVVDVLACPGLVAELDGQRAGLLTYIDDDGDVEIAYLEATTNQRGIGTALIDAVVKATGARRLWL